METHRKVIVPLVHRVEVVEAIHSLLHVLGGDDWYVACHHQHTFIVHLLTGGEKRFAACFECTQPVEKGIYHGSLATCLSVVPLGQTADLTLAQLQDMRQAMAEAARAGTV